MTNLPVELAPMGIEYLFSSFSEFLTAVYHVFLKQISSLIDILTDINSLTNFTQIRQKQILLIV